MEGRVLVDGQPAVKPGFFVSAGSAVSVRAEDEFVSRGGLKLKEAIERLGIKPSGKVCLDVGASTGGFTDCLLKYGAKKVYCVDVGRSLLDLKLKDDPRVVSIEDSNIRYLDACRINDIVELATVDVSFISLEKVLPKVMELVMPGGEVIALVKPQFEAPRGAAKKGVVKDESVRLQAIEKVKNAASVLGYEIAGGTDSPVKGPKGNLEYLLYMKTSSCTRP